jgi:MerR family transcriptional regulator, light-induced transcriptional regulator
MERSRMEGAHNESAGRHDRHDRHHDCDLSRAQIPLLGLAPDANHTLDASERLSKLLATFESNIIPRLAQSHAPAIGSAEADFLAKLLIAADDAPARQLVESLLQRGARRESLYIDLLTPAARRLGDMWVEDECTFGDVTVGVGRLHRMLRELVAASEPTWEAPLDGHRVLLLASPGEQHTLGLSIVSEFFRAARWDVTCTTDTHAPDPVATVKAEWFDVIGFSVGTHTRLDWLAIAIADVRRVSRNSAIVVLVGGPVISLHPEYVATVGADASASDGRQAPVVAGKLLTQLVQRG